MLYHTKPPAKYERNLERNVDGADDNDDESIVSPLCTGDTKSVKSKKIKDLTKHPEEVVPHLDPGIRLLNTWL